MLVISFLLILNFDVRSCQRNLIALILSNGLYCRLLSKHENYNTILFHISKHAKASQVQAKIVLSLKRVQIARSTH